jgi:protein TonB
VREAVTPPPLANPPPPLVIQTTKKEDRVENLGPPIITPGPPVQSPPAPPRPSQISNPDWLRQPNGDDLVQFFPPQALEQGTSGRTVMDCVVRADGTLTDCTVTSETPSGRGFGRAALQASRLFKMRPKTVDGAPVEGAHVTVPMRWNAPPPE